MIFYQSNLVKINKDLKEKVMKRKLFAMLLAGTMVTSMLVGCGSKKPAVSSGDDQQTVSNGSEEQSEASGEKETEENEDVTELKFYMMNGPVADSERVMAKANAIIEEKIGAKLNLIMIDSGTYAEKMNLMINSGDDWDLCFTASWGGINFFENAGKGAYADLTELLPKYAPETYSRIPEGLWEGVKVDGKIYASVNYQQYGVAARKGFQVRKDIAEEVGFDPETMKGKTTLEGMELLGQFFEKAVPAHTDMIGWETSAGYSFFANEPLMWDMEPIGDMVTPGWVRFTEPDTVINQFATEEFEAYCNIMRDWYNNGYVRKDGATVQDVTPDRKAAKILAMQYYGWPDSYDFPENADSIAMSMCTVDNAPAIGVSTTRTVIPAAAGNTAAVAVNAQSKNIEKSVELIELLNTDDELYRLITLGEEGVDYVFDEDGNYSLVEGKYNFNYNDWQIGQSYSPDFTRALYHNNESGKITKLSQSFVYEADKDADVSPVTGFTFDQSSVKTEMANCTAVMSEMIPALSNGSVDPATALPEFLSRLEVAGVDKVIAEKQAQYDAWRAAK